MTRARDVATQGGLVLISSTTIGTAVSSVTINNVFSSTYDNYKILLSGGTASGNNRIALGLGSSTSNNFGGFVRTTTSGGSLSAFGDGGASKFSYVAATELNGNNGDITLINPFLTKWTYITAFTRYGNDFGTYNGFQNLSASYTGFTLEFVAGNATGGTIQVYGYKK